MSSERIKKLCDYMDQNKAKNYPIENAMLYESEDFIKNGYLRILAVVLQVGNNITEGQLNLYKRIVEGASAENTTEEYMRQAMEIEIQEYTDFVNSCKEEQLRYRFLLDAILLAADGDNKEEQLKFIASFCEDIKMSKEELDYLASMAKAILEQSEAEYVDTFVEKSLEDISENLFAEYMNAIFDRQDKIYASDNAVLFRPLSESDITATSIKAIQQAKQPYVRIIGAHINLDEWNLSLVFKEKEYVIFEDCVFSGAGKNMIASKFNLLYLQNCKNVLIYNCEFKNFDTPVLLVEKVSDMRIINTKFEKCIYCYKRGSEDWKALGGVIHSGEPECMGEVQMISCKFEECGGKNVENYYSSEVLSNCRVKAVENQYINCWNYHQCYSYNGEQGELRDGTKDPDDDYRTLFTPTSEAINCTFENSAKFTSSRESTGEMEI